MSDLPPPLPPVVAKKKGLPAIAWVGIAAAIGILLLAGIGLLAFAGFTGGTVAIKKAKIVTTLATATDLENAINEFYMEYGALPDPGASKLSHDIVFDTSGPEGQKLLSIVMGKESGPVLQNPKNLAFYMGRAGKAGKNGLITLPSGLSELKDPWGNPYYVILDGDYDETLTPPADSGSTTPVKGHRVLIYSLGPNGKGGSTAVRTW